MRPGRRATLARRVPNAVARFHPSANWNTPHCCNMHVKDIPTRTLISIAIHIHDHSAIVGAHYQARRCRYHPIICRSAARCIHRWCKIQCRAYFHRSPSCMRTAREGPNHAGLEGQRKFRLHQLRSKQRRILLCNQPRIAKHGFIGS